MKHSKRCSPHADRHESAHSTRLTRWSRCRRVGSTRAPSIAPGSETRNPAQTAHNCKRERTCTMREVCVNAHALVARCLPRGGNRSHATPLEHHTHLILRHCMHMAMQILSCAQLGQPTAALFTPKRCQWASMARSRRAHAKEEGRISTAEHGAKACNR
jgi:hypothetical protein